MNLLERVLLLLRANINSMIEKADDPEQMLRQLQLDMRNQLVQVKTQVATAIAESHKLQGRGKEKTAEADLWFKKAEQAIRQNNDDSARKALSSYNDILRQAQRYQQQQKEQEQIVMTMRNALSQLEKKISEVDTTIDLLVTRKRNAMLQQRVFDALNKTGKQNTGERTARAQDALLEAEARARALAELQKRDLDSQMEQLSAEQLIEQQMQELRRKAGRREVPLLAEAETQPSPLLSPQPQKPEPAKKRVERHPEQPSGGLNEVQAQAPAKKEADIAELKRLLE